MLSVPHHQFITNIDFVLVGKITAAEIAAESGMIRMPGRVLITVILMEKIRMQIHMQQHQDGRLPEIHMLMIHTFVILMPGIHMLTRTYGIRMHVIHTGILISEILMREILMQDLHLITTHDQEIRKYDVAIYCSGFIS